MKTVTMDWETYQKELAKVEFEFERGFESGAKQADKRVRNIMDFLREFLKSTKTMDHIKLEALMKDAGEL